MKKEERCWRTGPEAVLGAQAGWTQDVDPDSPSHRVWMDRHGAADDCGWESQCAWRGVVCNLSFSLVCTGTRGADKGEVESV